MQHSSEKKWDKLEIRIYEGADGKFVLYEDENDNYNYEKGLHSTITFTWNDLEKTLTISDRSGDFPGMLKDREFNIVRIPKDRGIGIDMVGKFDKVVTYSGKDIVVEM